MKFDIIIPMGCYCASAQALKSVKREVVRCLLTGSDRFRLIRPSVFWKPDLKAFLKKKIW